MILDTSLYDLLDIKKSPQPKNNFNAMKEHESHPFVEIQFAKGKKHKNDVFFFLFFFFFFFYKKKY
jgi:hypothetical protein